MEHHETVPMEDKLVSKYMIAYADIWADVILNKNLLLHLNTIEDDLKHLNEIIDGKEALNCNALGVYRITNQLYRMRDIVVKKVSVLQQH